jgi:predicted permease
MHMSRLRALFSRFAALLRKRQLEQELDEELQSHLQFLVEENIRKGMSPGKARYAAHREFGGVEQVKEAYREQRGLPMLGTLFQDLRYGWRQLKRSPGFTAVAVVTLALGIGANTAIFSIVDAVLLRPLPYKHSDRLVAVWSTETKERGSKLFSSYRDFEQWQAHNQSFEQLEACTWATRGGVLTWHGTSQNVLAIPATQGFFSLLGARAMLGRTFAPEDLQEGCSVVLAHDLWQNRLGSPADIIGKSLILDGKSCNVAGIMPPGFDFYPRQTSVWTLITPQSDFARHPIDNPVAVFGRLKTGVPKDRALAELAGLHQRVVQEAPAGSWVTEVVPVIYDLQEEFTWLAGRNLRTALLVLLAAVSFVLLIACVNVADLLLGRSSVRERELAIRAALGCGRARLVRQLLTESLLLSSLGAGLGILLATAAVGYFRAANPVELPPGNPVGVNMQVLGFSAVLTLLTGLLFGLFPAWRTSRLDLNRALKEAGRGVGKGVSSRRTDKLFVVVQVALSLALLAGAGLLIESTARLGSASLGFRTDHLLTASVDLPAAAFSQQTERARFYDKLTSRLSALPGVKGIALMSALPFYGTAEYSVSVRGGPSPSSDVGDAGPAEVSDDYFRVLGIPLLQGRNFDSRDREDSLPVTIVNETLVREYFPRADPIGRQIKLGMPEGKAPWLTIVGVVGDVKHSIVYKEMGYVVAPVVFRPLSQAAGRSIFLAIRTAGSPLFLVSTLPREASGLESNVVVSDVRTMDERVSGLLAHPRFRAVLLGIFAGLALVLAAIGIYGVLAQSVLQRTHEIGIRMALGAERRRLLCLFVAQGAVLAFAGVGAGLLMALALTRYLAGMLYGVRPTDPLTFAAVSALLVVVALVASYVPARRASRVDPMVALRYE